MHLPFIGRQLPRTYTGSYAVGAIDVELPIPRQQVGEFKMKGQSDESSTGIVMDSLLCTLFYPCEKKTGNGKTVFWVSRPIFQTLHGYVRFAGKEDSFLARWLTYPLAYALFGSTYLPVESHARLEKTAGKLPVIIFSHGLAGSRRMYSSFCGEMAARGFLVAAIEHRDGSGPATTVLNEDGTTRVVEWLRAEDLEWPTGSESSSMALRKVQLQARMFEIKATIDLISRLDSSKQLPSCEGYDWSLWRNRINKDDITMAGHSFGGGSTIVACHELGNVFKKGIALDPWLEPVDVNSTPISQPLLVINSEAFTVWKGHYQNLKRFIQQSPSSILLTIAGCTHHAFSDFPLLLPHWTNARMNLTVEPVRAMSIIVERVSAFLGKGHDETLNNTIAVDETPTRPIGEPGQVLVSW